MRNIHAAAVCLLSSALAFTLGVSLMTMRDVAGPVYLTAAHLDPSELPGYTLMYSDVTRDTAYYLKDDYRYNTPKIGETVFIGDNRYTVTSVKENMGFYVECLDAYRGMSGTRVLNKEREEIAFVSAAKPNGDLLCISTK